MQPVSSAPMTLLVDGSRVVFRSLDDAVGFMKGHPSYEHAEMLMDQMEAASHPELERRAWMAFATFTEAMGISSGAPARLS